MLRWMPEQWRCFLPTNDHFSSSCTLVVEGGNARQLIMELAGVVPGERGVAGDGILADPDEPAGLTDAAAVGRVGEHGEGLVVGQAAAEERGALALGEPGLARGAVQEAALVLAVAGTDGEIALAPLAVRGALGLEAAEPTQVVVHGSDPGKSTRSEVGHHKR